MRYNDLTGKRFGRLIVLCRAPNRGNGHAYWNCKCDCGNTTVTRTISLTSGHTQSCSCIHSETISKLMFKHGVTVPGHTKAGLYSSWKSMKARCDNAKSTKYYMYGAKGITYEPRWKNFKAFRRDMESGWQKGLTLDRKDGTKGYSKDNCKWSTASEQSHNMSRNRWIEFAGERLIVADWARKLDMPANSITGRLERGWTIAEALTRPTRVKAAPNQATAAPRW